MPFDGAGQDHAGHAEIVHEGDAEAEDRAARGNGGCAARGNRQQQAGGRHRDRDGKRQQRRPDVIASQITRIVGQHRDKMGGPDAEAAGGAGRAEPEIAPRRCGILRPLRQRDRHVAGEEADQCCEQHQAKIMLDDDTIEDA